LRRARVMDQFLVPARPLYTYVLGQGRGNRSDRTVRDRICSSCRSLAPPFSSFFAIPNSCMLIQISRRSPFELPASSCESAFCELQRGRTRPDSSGPPRLSCHNRSFHTRTSSQYIMSFNLFSATLNLALACLQGRTKCADYLCSRKEKKKTRARRYGAAYRTCRDSGTHAHGMQSKQHRSSSAVESVHRPVSSGPTYCCQYICSAPIILSDKCTVLFSLHVRSSTDQTPVHLRIVTVFPSCLFTNS
jgi:hypothetical protein